MSMFNAFAKLTGILSIIFLPSIMIYANNDTIGYAYAPNRIPIDGNFSEWTKEIITLPDQGKCL